MPTTPEAINQKVAVVLDTDDAVRVVIVNAGSPGPANNWINIISSADVSFPFFQSVKLSNDFLVSQLSSSVVGLSLSDQSTVIKQMLDNLSRTADNLQLTSDEFDGNLAPEDNTVLKAFKKIDDLDLSIAQSESGGGAGSFQAYSRRIMFGTSPDFTPNIYYLGNRTGTNITLRSITVWVKQPMAIPSTNLVMTVNGGNNILLPNTVVELDTIGKYQLVFQPEDIQPTVDGMVFVQFSHPISALTAGDIVVRMKYIET